MNDLHGCTLAMHQAVLHDNRLGVLFLCQYANARTSYEPEQAVMRLCIRYCKNRKSKGLIVR